MKLIHFTIVAVVVVILVGGILYPVANNGEMEKNTLEVLIIDGQSNAEYGDSAVCDPDILNAEYTEVPTHNIYYYGTTTAPANQWDWSTTYSYAWTAFHIQNAYDYTSDEWKIGGYEPILGNTIAEESGNDVLVVNMAIGARTIAQLLPDGDDGEYSWGVLDRALSEISKNYNKIEMVGVVWIQGESDNETEVDTYKESFVELMDAFEDYGADEFYIVATRDSYGGNACTAQDELAEEYNNVTIATEITETFTVDNGMLDSGNPIHYSQYGRDAIANAIKDVIEVPEVEPWAYSSLATIIPVVVLVSLIPIGASLILRSKSD